MKSGKPFFYRLEASEFFAETLKIKSDKELGKFIRQFSVDLVTGNASSPYAEKVINEAIEYIEKKRNAGKIRAEQRYSTATAPLQECYSTGLARSSNRSSTEAVTETKEKKHKTLSPENGGCPHFKTFWAAYPQTHRRGKGYAEQCWKKIKRPGETINIILAALEWQKESEHWTKSNGDFIPNPSTYINQRRWEDEKPVDFVDELFK
jgi:hypothetical protein